MAQWLVRRTWNQKVESSSPGRYTHVLDLGKTLNSQSASFHTGVQVGTSKFLWGQPDKLLRWTSIPSRGSRNTPSRFILQKPEISAGTDEPSGSANCYWGRLYLYLGLKSQQPWTAVSAILVALISMAQVADDLALTKINHYYYLMRAQRPTDVN